MATIVIEDGTGKTDSNSYASVAELDAYAADRGIIIATADHTTLLISAMDNVEPSNFKGNKNTDAQALQWPRYGVVIDSYYVLTTEIPLLLKEAQIEFALGIDGGTNPQANVDRATKSEKVDVIEVVYMDSARDTVYLKAANTKLTKLLKNGGSSAVVIRG